MYLIQIKVHMLYTDSSYTKQKECKKYSTQLKSVTLKCTDTVTGMLPCCTGNYILMLKHVKRRYFMSSYHVDIIIIP